MGERHEEYLDDYFRRTLLPVLTPVAIDPGHPFPYIANRSVCLLVSLRSTAASVLPQASLSIIHVPTQVPRFVPVPAPAGQHAFMLLEDVIRLRLPRLYRGYDIVSSHAIRVTRDADLQLGRGRAQDLLISIEQSLRERQMGTTVPFSTRAICRPTSRAHWWRSSS